MFDDIAEPTWQQWEDFDPDNPGAALTRDPIHFASARYPWYGKSIPYVATPGYEVGAKLAWVKGLPFMTSDREVYLNTLVFDLEDTEASQLPAETQEICRGLGSGVWS